VYAAIRYQSPRSWLIHNLDVLKFENVFCLVWKLVPNVFRIPRQELCPLLEKCHAAGARGTTIGLDDVECAVDIVGRIVVIVRLFDIVGVHNRTRSSCSNVSRLWLDGVECAGDIAGRMVVIA
jgi:hypothetical protein